jgi:hypothetical protein
MMCTYDDGYDNEVYVIGYNKECFTNIYICMYSFVSGCSIGIYIYTYIYI